MGLLEWILGCPEPKPVDPPNFQSHAKAGDPRGMSADPFDDWDGSEALLIAINYQDESGYESSRVVTVHEIYIKSDLYYFRGWCHLRSDFRTFRVDRIQQLANGTTGEICGDPAAFFRRILAPAVKASIAEAEQRESLKQAKEALKDELYILQYIAHADGSAHASESDIIKKYIDYRLSNIGIMLDPTTLGFFNEWSSCLMPAKRTMLCSVGRVQSDKSIFQMLGKAVIDLVKADGVSHPDELEAVGSLVGHVHKKRK